MRCGSERAAQGSRFSGTATSPSGTPRAGLSDVVRSFYEDPNGTVWVGSDAGLSRYVNGRFETFGAAQGVFRKGVMTISGDPDGTIWAGTLGDGLYRYKDGDVHALLHGQRPVRRHRVPDRRRPAGQPVDDVQPRCLPGQQADADRPRRAAGERDRVGVVRGGRRDEGRRVQRQRAARGDSGARWHALVPDHQGRRVGAPGQAGREPRCLRPSSSSGWWPIAGRSP